MREIKFVVKAEQQEKLLKSASFIVSEKILFGTMFGEGMLTIDNPTIDSDESLESYISKKFDNLNDDPLRNMLIVKAVTSIGMFLLGEQLNEGWKFKSVKADLEDLLFTIPFFDSGIIKCLPELEDEEDEEVVVNDGFEHSYLRSAKNAFLVAELLCNYVPVSDAIIEISNILSRGMLKKDDEKLINQILGNIEDYPYLNFLNALELFAFNVEIREFESDDAEANELWRNSI
jgi:hypothetical protein